MQQVLQANDCCQLPTKSPSKLHTVRDIMVADDVHLLFLHPQQSKNFIFTFILQFQPKAKDIFLLGCCDHSSFSLCFSSSCVHFIFTFILQFQPKAKDVFLLGCCDHRFCDHSSFSLCFSSKLCT
jgi:hypothetical protein